MTSTPVLVLSRADVEHSVTIEGAITAMRSAFIELSAGRVEVPLRTRLPLASPDGVALVMPVYAAGMRRLAVKTVTIVPDNAARGLSTTQALVTVFGAEDGRPQAILDGEVLTALRTGAASGLATDLLARREAAVAAVIGAGAQGRWQLRAVCAVRRIARALVFDRVAERARVFADEMGRTLGISVQVLDDVAGISDADVVCTATASRQPVFAAAHLRPGAHVNGIGSFRPDMQEIPAETIAAAKVVVDSRPACLSEAGDLVQPLRAGLIGAGHIHAELGEVAAGSRPGRTSAGEITVFKSVGNAVQDLAAAALALEGARRRGLGTKIEL